MTGIAPGAVDAVGGVLRDAGSAHDEGFERFYEAFEEARGRKGHVTGEELVRALTDALGTVGETIGEVAGEAMAHVHRHGREQAMTWLEGTDGEA